MVSDRSWVAGQLRKDQRERLVVLVGREGGRLRRIAPGRGGGRAGRRRGRERGKAWASATARAVLLRMGTAGAPGKTAAAEMDEGETKGPWALGKEVSHVSLISPIFHFLFAIKNLL